MNFVEMLLKLNISNHDAIKLQSDIEELDKINNEMPKDGVIDISEAERLAGLCMRGISICDYWIPQFMVFIGELESRRDKAFANAYIEAEGPKVGRLTADVRKQIAEGDDEYNNYKMLVVRYKASKESFSRKSDSLMKFHFFLKDQQKRYDYNGGRHISGEGQTFKKDKGTTGEQDW